MSEPQIISRAIISHILKAWLGTEMLPEEVQHWAEIRFNSGAFELDDWEDQGSIANEALALLDTLDLNLIIEDDIPALLEMLDTPPGKFEAGFAKWQEYFRAVDIKKRAQDLAGRDPYAPYCK
ncbi:MAG TPA: hypothetical protein VFG11_02195 [Acidobacteriota bacterium]|nr:hypothetical protein [Acidobacteriota bacterium]